MIPTILLIVAALFVVYAALLASIESAYSVTSRADLSEIAEQNPSVKALKQISLDPDVHRNAIGFIRVFSEMTAAALITIAFVQLFNNIWWALLASVVLLTGISFIAIGTSPRNAGRKNPKRTIKRSAKVVRAVRIGLGPFAHGLVGLSNRVTPNSARGAFASEEQLLSMVDEAASRDLIEEDDRELIHSVFDFTDQLVRELMVPHTNMVTVDSDASLEDAMRLFVERGISRMPIVDSEADDVVGMLYLKDVSRYAFTQESKWKQESVRALSRVVTFVPESMKAATLLQQMRKDSVHACIVVDEYGAVAGLITLEDLVEEIVGEISDEHDSRSSEIVELSPGRFQISAHIGLDEVGELFGLELSDEDIDSIGGALGKALGRMPVTGSNAEVDGLLLTGGASRGRGRGVETVFVERVSEAASIRSKTDK